MRDERKRKIKPQKTAGKAGAIKQKGKPALLFKAPYEIFRKFLMVSSDAVIITDMRGKIVFLSDKAMSLYGGKSVKEIRGKPSFDFLDDADKKKAAANRARILKEGFVSGIEYGLELPNGKRAILRSNSALIKDAAGMPQFVITTIGDVTRSREIEETLQHSEEIFRNLMDTSPDAVVVTDMDSKIIYCSEQIKELTGYDCEEAMGRKAGEIIIQAGGEEFRGLKEEILKKGFIKGLEYTVKRRNGREYTGEINAALLKNSKGKTRGILSIIRDVTEKKKVEQELKQSNAMFKKVMEGIISAMEKLVEKKDMYTVGHQRRTAGLARTIGATMGLPREQLECIYIASIIHDIGKIFISGAILNKKARLTEYEYDIIKKHPEAGYEILKTIDFPWPLADIVLQHHERLDGSGYPYGLKGDRIYLESRIISVADVVEAITFERPYRPALGVDRALEEIESKKGALYDTEVVDICVELFREKRFSWE